MVIETLSLADVPEAAEKILRVCSNDRIFAIYGEMGAGKTTLVKSMCMLLGTGDVVKSPTFAIVNEYDSPDGSIYHFDFYRIRNLEEVYDLGFEEYIDSGNYCFIEWPEKIGPLLPPEAVVVRIEPTGPEARRILIDSQ